MFIDAQTLLTASTGQAVTADAVSTNAYDKGAAAVTNGPFRDLAIGEPMCVVLSVVVAADHTTGDEATTFNIIEDTVATLDSTPTIIASFPFTAAQVTAGALAAGKIYALPIPMAASSMRYLGLAFDVTGTTPTGTYAAWVAPMSMVQQSKNYPTLINVL